jgi:hypothetical protein
MGFTVLTDLVGSRLGMLIVETIAKNGQRFLFNPGR